MRYKSRQQPLKMALARQEPAGTELFDTRARRDARKNRRFAHRTTCFAPAQLQLPSPPRVTVRLVVAPLRGPGRSPVLPFACCVGSLRSVGRCGRCSSPPPRSPPSRLLCLPLYCAHLEPDVFHSACCPLALGSPLLSHVQPWVGGWWSLGAVLKGCP